MFTNIFFQTYFVCIADTDECGPGTYFYTVIKILSVYWIGNRGWLLALNDDVVSQLFPN